MLKTRHTPDGILIDTEASDAFAMVDHQIAHVYATCPRSRRGSQRPSCAGHRLQVLRPDAIGLDHRRSGDLILIAPEDAWLDYRWWHDPSHAPAFASQIDIHRKPGYDPLELFWKNRPNPSVRIRLKSTAATAAPLPTPSSPRQNLPASSIPATNVRTLIEKSLLS